MGENWLLRLIRQHYTTTGGASKARTELDLRRERWLLPGLPLAPFNRWALLPAAFVIHICIGSLYAWSVFNKPIDSHIHGGGDGEVRNLAPTTFYIAVGCLGAAAAVMGPWLERHGPRRAAVLGSSLFFAGNLLTALGLLVRLIWLVYFGYGVVAGIGIGICYISPVSCLQKWFPERRGLASGCAVCGFGAGAIVSARVQVALLDTIGLPSAFTLLGSIYFVLMLGAALVLRTPPPPDSVREGADSVYPERAPNGLDSPPPAAMPLIEALTSHTYRLMWVMFFANILFGLVLISRLSNLVTDIFARSPAEAATIVAINGAFNLGGRLALSTLSDVVGRKTCYVTMLTTQLVILGAFSTITTAAPGSYWAFLLTMWILTACYGGGFGVIPAFLTDHFGPANIGACHGLLLTAWSLAGVVGGLVFTFVFDWLQGQSQGASDPHPYNVNVWWMFGVVGVGWIAALWVEPTEKDKKFWGKLRF